MGFRSSIMAGKNLIREAIQSPNFLSGITGWAIRRDGTAEFSDLTIRSGDGSGSTTSIEDGKATFHASNGWEIVIDPTRPLPVVEFYDAEGDTSGFISATGDNARTGITLSSGTFASGATSDWRWLTAMGQADGGVDRWLTGRYSQSDATVFKGGYTYLDGSTAQIGIQDSADATVRTQVKITDGVFWLDHGVLLVTPEASSGSATRIVTASGHTGYNMAWEHNGAYLAHLGTDGKLAVFGEIVASGPVSGDNMRWGSSTTPAPGAGGGTTSFDVTFTDAMSSVPNINITPNTTVDPKPSASGGVDIRGYVTNRTVNGFRINCYRSSNSSTSWMWTAFGD